MGCTTALRSQVNRTIGTSDDILEAWEEKGARHERDFVTALDEAGGGGALSSEREAPVLEGERDEERCA
jgi:hypothetical protein